MARPRKFDEKKVLVLLTNIFWKNGYDGTTMDAILFATGLQKGSLYSCFGNKEIIFKLALNHYAKDGPFYSLSDIKSPLKRLALFYETLILGSKNPDKQRLGCFVFNSSLEFAGKKNLLAAFVDELGKKNELFFHVLMREAKTTFEFSEKVSEKTAAERAHAAAFTIQEMSKFKSSRSFLADIANSMFESIGAAQRVWA